MAPGEITAYQKNDPELGWEYMQLDYTWNVVRTVGEAGGVRTTEAQYDEEDQRLVAELFQAELVETYVADSMREQALAGPSTEDPEGGEDTTLCEPADAPSVDNPNLCLPPVGMTGSGWMRYRVSTFYGVLPTGVPLPHVLKYGHSDEGRSEPTKEMLQTLEDLFLRYHARDAGTADGS